MGILRRLTRIIIADLHGVMDQLENRELILKQSLREMRSELDRRESALGRLYRTREEAERELARIAAEWDGLDRDLTAAIEKDKENLARPLARKFLDLGRRRGELRDHIEDLNRDLDRFREELDARRQAYERIRLKAADFFRRAEVNRLQPEPPPARSGFSPAADEAEIEMELFRRKAALKQEAGHEAS